MRSAALPAPRGAAARLSALACLVGALLAGCATRTTVPDLPHDVPAAWQTSAAGGLKPDLQNWWRAFDDTTLDQLIERALRDNLTLHIAGERLVAARALRHRSRSDFWPNLNFRTYVETAPNARTGYLETGFDASWEFGFFGRGEANRRINLADENNAVVDEAAARASVIAEVARNYIELRAAQARARILDDVLALRRRQVELAQTRLRTHMGSQLELDRSEAELQQAVNEAGEPALTALQTTQALGVLLGTSDAHWSESLQQTATQPTLPRVAIGEAPADLVRTRPEIRRAEQNVLRAAGELGIARADLYPKLGLAFTFISSTAITGDVNRLNDFVPIAGPTVSLPLVDWNARREVVNAREAALSAAVLAYREAVLEGIAEAQSTLAQFEAKSTLVDNAQKSLGLSRRGATSAQALQRIGLGDGLDSASANLALAQSRLQQSLAQRDRALAFIALYKAFGGAMPPLPSDGKPGAPE